MFSDPVDPADRRSPLGGSAKLWWGLAIALGILAAGLILPTLGAGPSNPGGSFDDDLNPSPSPAQSGPAEDIVSA